MAQSKLSPDDRIGGYFASFLAFGAITALWAFVVRGDDFYGMREIFGVTLPTTTVFYLVTMPVIGFVVGRWRYHQSGGGGGMGWLGKGVARAANFAYSHLLIVLFTAAMASEAFLGWNLDQAVQTIDDQLFDMASRFAPWLSAYLAGFNLGRGTGLSAWRKRNGGGDIRGGDKRLMTERPINNAPFDDQDVNLGEPRIDSGFGDPGFGVAADPDQASFQRDEAFMDQRRQFAPDHDARFADQRYDDDDPQSMVEQYARPGYKRLR